MLTRAWDASRLTTAWRPWLRVNLAQNTKGYNDERRGFY